MPKCFICLKPTIRERSLTQLTHPPTSRMDTVPICLECNDDWSTALIENIRSDLILLQNSRISTIPFHRHIQNPNL